MSEHRQTPTHCVKGHPAQWCDCKRFVPAEPGAFTEMPTIRYPDSAEAAMGATVACPNCGQEQPRLSTIGTEEYIATCGPTCGCGHKWTVYPEPVGQVIDLMAALRASLARATPRHPSERRAMTEREQRAAELMRLTQDDGRTHWEECWRVVGHHGCAIARAEMLLAERDRLTWQPIETAPKDGSDCLLWNGEEVSYGGWLSEEEQRGGLGDDFEFTADWWSVHGGTPTHWMPAPNPPAP